MVEVTESATKQIAEYFKGVSSVNISGIYCNKNDAYVLKRAENLGIPSLVFNKKDFYDSGLILEKLIIEKTDLIVLAGFLWLIPLNILKRFADKIINIHPALLPKYGGKGMYGSRVHEAVINAGDKESGITIHYVNEKYDEGEIVFQAKCKVEKNDSPESLAKKIHLLEYEYYPKIIEKVVFG